MRGSPRARPGGGRPAAYLTAGRDRDLGRQRSVADLRRRTEDVLDAAVGRRGPLRRRGPLVRPGRGVPRRLARRAPGRPTSRSAPSGATATSATGGSTPTCTRSRTTRWRRSSTQRDETLGAARRTGWRSTTCTAPPWRPACWRTRALHRAMAELRDRGVRVGVSTSGPQQAEVGAARARGHRRRRAAVHLRADAPGTCWRPRSRPALAEAAAAGARCSSRRRWRTAGWRRAARTAVRRRAGCTRWPPSWGSPADVLAVAVGSHQPWADLVLSGAVTPEQLRSNAAAAELDVPEPVPLLELAGLAEEPERLLGGPVAAGLAMSSQGADRGTRVGRAGVGAVDRACGCRAPPALRRRGRLGCVEVANSLGLAKGTAHGILRTLQDVGFVEQDRPTGKYLLGAGLLDLDDAPLRPQRAALAWRSTGPTPWPPAAGQTVRLGVLEAGRRARRPPRLPARRLRAGHGGRVGTAGARLRARQGAAGVRRGRGRRPPAAALPTYTPHTVRSSPAARRDARAGARRRAGRWRPRSARWGRPASPRPCATGAA